MKQRLKQVISAEKMLYIPHIRTLKNKIMAIYTHNEEYEIYRFICALRKAEFYKTRNKLLYTYYLRKSNMRGNRLGFFIAPGVLGEGVRLFHRGGVIINSQSVIGNGCRFHGDNCVGNNGIDNRCPVLGKNIDVGIGAKIIGGVTLADNKKLAHSVVRTCKVGHYDVLTLLFLNTFYNLLY